MERSRNAAIARRWSRVALTTLILSGTVALGDSSTTTQRSITRVAEGVHVIRHPDAPDTFPQGNTTVIIGDRGVLVVDSCLLPSSAREDIEQIRKWTDKPVTWLLNTHWHFDHTLGNRTYAEAFPAIQIVAHTATRKTIADYNPGAVARYPGRAGRFRKILESGKDTDGSPLTAGERKDYERSLAGLAPVVEEFKNTTQLAPNVVFDDTLDIDLGNRQVQIRHLGPGNTAGDTLVYLPTEKILVTGDLLVHPIPYFFGGFPVDFPRTLRAMAQIDAQTIVPGHGEVQRSKDYILRVVDLLETVNAQIEKEINEGRTLEEVGQSVPGAAGVVAQRRKFAGSDIDEGEFFDTTLEALIKAAYNQIKMR